MGSRRFVAHVGVVLVVHAAFATLLAPAPRREGTLGPAPRRQTEPGATSPRSRRARLQHAFATG